MRYLLLTSLVALASPVVAQPMPPRALAPIGPEALPIPPALTDPAMPDQAGRVAGALTRALLNLPVGEIAASIDGRPVTPSDRHRTVASETGTDPALGRLVERQVATGSALLQDRATAVARALPALEQALGQAVSAIDRAAANLPDPNYPRR